MLVVTVHCSSDVDVEIFLSEGGMEGKLHDLFGKLNRKFLFHLFSFDFLNTVTFLGTQDALHSQAHTQSFSNQAISWEQFS
jgi:hypothetical protein